MMYYMLILTKEVKSSPAKWWRKEKSVMISDSGGAWPELAERSVMCDQ